MEPVKVSTTVARPREQVFEFLDDLSNHAGFLKHMFVDWSFSGPGRGVGAKAKARVSAPGSREMAEFEVVESVAPERTVEEGVSSNGNRRTRGTYSLTELSDGGTGIEFTLEWLQAPRSERIVPAISRAFLRRALGKAMRRLKKELEAS